MKGLLKFITCGSVDDGKSTLIGHILYDSKLLYADQEEALKLDSTVGSAGGDIDYSLLLDGLMAEREQGITIDVAYRYFTTDERSFIVADTPGHEEYTRNMAVGASFADLAVILIDATQGVLIQTKRHARICSLMGIRHFVFAVNKMDLTSYDEKIFLEIKKQIAELVEELEISKNNITIKIIPVSATVGDNITQKSHNTPWYTENTLLDYLEHIDVDDYTLENGFYMPVQRVSRPDHTFRGFQGQIEAGEISVGDEIITLPSHEKANISGIYVGDKKEEKASVGQPVTICLDREVDVSRGSVLTKEETVGETSEGGIRVSSGFEAALLWMDDDSLISGKNFFVKIGTKLIPGVVTSIVYQIDVNTGKRKKVDSLSKNELAIVRVSLTDRIVLDEFSAHKTLGELILIDRVTNATSACGVITEVSEEGASKINRIRRQTREALNGQRSLIAQFELSGRYKLETAQEVEKLLVQDGRHTYLYHPTSDESVIEVLEHLVRAGLVVVFAKDVDIDVAGVEQKLGENSYYEVNSEKSGDTPREIADYIIELSRYSAETEVGGYI